MTAYFYIAAIILLVAIELDELLREDADEAERALHELFFYVSLARGVQPGWAAADARSLRLHQMWQSISRLGRELIEARRARAFQRRAQRRQRLLETARRGEAGSDLPPDQNA